MDGYMLNYYNILGVPKSASMEEIRNAYIKQIKFFHPDVFNGPPEVARIKTVQLNEAYSVLHDPQKRQVYDLRLEYEEQKAKEEEKARKAEEKVKEDAKKAEEQAGKGAESARTENEKKNHQKKTPNSTPKVLCAIFAIICFALCAVCINLEEENRELGKNIDELEEKYTRIDQLYDSTYKERSQLELELLENTRELNYWRDHAVIVTEYGEKYHTYGCQYINGRAFWIYNIELAIVMGYEPCTVCNPPS